ncbi:MAG: hypothetical protein AAGG75_23300 [Bacteroidota bacterium]
MNASIAKQLSDGDEILQNIIKTIPLPPLESSQNVFHDLMSCIIEQQIHYRSTRRTFQRMLEAAGLEELRPDNFEVFEEKGIGSYKLSGRKLETIARILDFFENNTIDWSSKSDADVRQLLSQIKGVGAWTIDMILLYTLARPNIFPADDHHLKQVINQHYPIDGSARGKAQLKAIGQRWSPYASFGVRYLLAWKVYQKKAVS